MRDQQRVVVPGGPGQAAPLHAVEVARELVLAQEIAGCIPAARERQPHRLGARAARRSALSSGSPSARVRRTRTTSPAPRGSERWPGRTPRSGGGSPSACARGRDPLEVTLAMQADAVRDAARSRTARQPSRTSADAIVDELAARLRGPGRALVRRGAVRPSSRSTCSTARAIAAATAGSSGSGVISSSRTRSLFVRRRSHEHHPEEAPDGHLLGIEAAVLEIPRPCRRSSRRARPGTPRDRCSPSPRDGARNRGGAVIGTRRAGRSLAVSCTDVASIERTRLTDARPPTGGHCELVMPSRALTAPPPRRGGHDGRASTAAGVTARLTTGCSRAAVWGARRAW